MRDGSADSGTCRRFTRAGISAVSIGASSVTRDTACLPAISDSMRLLIACTAGARPRAARRRGPLKADDERLAGVRAGARHDA